MAHERRVHERRIVRVLELAGLKDLVLKPEVSGCPDLELQVVFGIDIGLLCAEIVQIADNGIMRHGIDQQQVVRARTQTSILEAVLRHRENRSSTLMQIYGPRPIREAGSGLCSVRTLARWICAVNQTRVREPFDSVDGSLRIVDSAEIRTGGG
jgi:hypothetical protein